MKYDFDLAWTEDNSMTLLLKQIKPGSTVLEFGTATGYMTQYLRETLDCRVYGVEIDAGAAASAAEYTEDMIVTDIDTLIWAKQWEHLSFDYILFADVLEHLRDPWTVLKKAAELLKENGVMLTSIPNISHNAVIMELLLGRFDYRKLGLLDDTHIRFFTRESVRQLFAQAGLKPFLWMDTRAKAQNTEIKAQPELFTDTFRQLLASRVDGEVYQFVTASRKCDFAAKEESEEVLLTSYLHSNLLQLYWPTAAGFAENASLCLPLDPGKAFVRYEFILPQGLSGELRLDPGSRPARGDIASLRLLRDGEEIQVWQAENRFDGLQFNYGIVPLAKEEKTYSFICLHQDPQLKLTKIDWEQAYAKPGELRLEVILRVDLEAPLQSLEPVQSYYETALAAQRQQTNHYETLLQREQAERQSLTEEVQRLRENERLAAEKCAAAEAQLEAMLHSHSWKATAPLRKVGSLLKK